MDRLRVSAQPCVPGGIVSNSRACRVPATHAPDPPGPLPNGNLLSERKASSYNLL